MLDQYLQSLGKCSVLYAILLTNTFSCDKPASINVKPHSLESVVAHADNPTVQKQPPTEKEYLESLRKEYLDLDLKEYEKLTQSYDELKKVFGPFIKLKPDVTEQAAKDFYDNKLDKNTRKIIFTAYLMRDKLKEEHEKSMKNPEYKKKFDDVLKSNGFDEKFKDLPWQDDGSIRWLYFQIFKDFSLPF